MQSRQAKSQNTSRRHSVLRWLEVLEDRTVPSFVGFTQPVNYGLAGSVPSVAVADLTGNGKMDLVAADGQDSGVGVFFGNGDGTFQQEVKGFLAGPPGGNAQWVVAGDFNGDGKPDLAVAFQYFPNYVSVLLSNGDGTFQAPRLTPVGQPYGGSSVGAMVAGDFDRNGTLDLAVCNQSNVSILLGNGDGTFRAGPNLPAYFALNVVAGDFDGDGTPDLAVTSAYNGVSVFLGNGDGTFGAPQTIATGGYYGLVTGDLNGDGKLDLAAVTGQQSGVAVSVMLGNGNGTFQAPQSYATGFSSLSTEVSNLALGDFDVDGTPDLIVAGSAVLLGNGDGTFQPPQTFAGLVGEATAVGDFNGDGRPDLAVGNLAGVVSVLLNELPLSAAAVNFNPTAGAPFGGPVATFTNPFPSATADSFSASIDWGDGSTSTGTVSGTGTLTVGGSHTYADTGSYAVTVSLSSTIAALPAAAIVYPTATVTSLGQGVQKGLEAGTGLWHNKNGQALINSFNGGPNSTELSSWLASKFADLYGVYSANDLWGYTNAQVAAFYQSLFALPGSLDAQVLATALNIYATTLSLGGTIGTAYGFTVSADGLGAYSFNVGADGAAFGVANNTTLNVYEILKAVDQQAAFGLLYNGDKTLRNEASDLFTALMQSGSIH
jgi:hypothetical protein